VAAGLVHHRKLSALELISTDGIRFESHGLRDNVAQIVQFQCRGTRGGVVAPQLVVANTHLLFNPKRGDIKLAQLRVLIARLCALLESSKTPIVSIVAGDFNLEPGEVPP
jgi:hypothetical protein